MFKKKKNSEMFLTCWVGLEMIFFHKIGYLKKASLLLEVPKTLLLLMKFCFVKCLVLFSLLYGHGALRDWVRLWQNSGYFSIVCLVPTGLFRNLGLFFWYSLAYIPRPLWACLRLFVCSSDRSYILPAVLRPFLLLSLSVRVHLSPRFNLFPL